MLMSSIKLPYGWRVFVLPCHVCAVIPSVLLFLVRKLEKTIKHLEGEDLSKSTRLFYYFPPVKHAEFQLYGTICSCTFLFQSGIQMLASACNQDES